MKLLIILLGFLALILVLKLYSSQKNKPLNSGDGYLMLCPESPNCVSSKMSDSHFIPHIQAHKNRTTTMSDIAHAIQGMPGGSVLHSKGNYLHAVFTSRFFKFTDDLECYYDPEAEIIHIKSASRLGYYDFGQNRKRVEYLRKIYSEM